MEYEAPGPIRVACGLGLSRWRRYKVGGTSKSVEFAEDITGGFRIDAQRAYEVAAAHEALASAIDPLGNESPEVQISRMLWGGDEAYEWAQQIITRDKSKPLPLLETEPTAKPADPADQLDQFEPIAAATQGAEPLDRLADRLFSLDQSVLDALEAAFWMAYRTALRRSSAAAVKQANRRVPIAAQTEAGLSGDDLAEARKLQGLAGPYDRWAVLPDPIIAAIDADLERALVDTLDDFEQTAEQILSEAAISAQVAIEDELALAAAETGDSITLGESAAAAALFLRGELFEWVRLRLSGDRDPGDLPELEVPPNSFRDATAIAGGAATVSGRVARTDGIAVDPVGEPVADSIGGGLLDRTLRSIASGQLATTVISVLPTRTFEWVYGSRTRETQFEPHKELDGRKWTAGQAGPAALQGLRGDGYYPGDHQGCKCTLKRRWEFI